MDVIHKISLYADDVLLFLQNADTPLPSTLETIKKLQLSLMNWNKSNYLPIGYAFSPHPNTPLKSGNIKYLGITISATLPYLLQLNHIPLLKIIEEDLARWSNLPLSLIGRVATIKMSILPKKSHLVRSKRHSKFGQ